MKPILIALLLAKGGDAASTCAAWSRGAGELNPFAPKSCPGMIAMSAGITAAQTALLVKLNEKHPKATRFLGWSFVGASVGATANNIGVYISLGGPR